LKRLADTNKMVDEMKAELILLRPKIDEKTVETGKTALPALLPEVPYVRDP